MNPKVDFYEGHIFLNNLQVTLMPLNSFLCFINEVIENEDKDFIISNLIESLNEDTEILLSNISNKKPKTTIIKEFVTKINSLGIGEISLKQLNNKNIIFSENNQFLNKNYYKIYKKNPKINLEIILFSYLINLIQKIYKKKITYEFSKQLNKSILKIKFLTQEIEEKKSIKNYDSNIITKVKPSPILQKIILNKQIIFKNGKVTLWNTFATFIPLIGLINFASKLPREYDIFLEGLGAMQGKAAVGLQKKIFGIKKKAMFKQIIEQTELIGIGKTEFELNEKSLIFTLNNNLIEHYSQFYKKEEIYLIKTLFESLIKGAYDFSFEINSEKKDYKNKKILQNNSNERNLTKKEKIIDNYINAKALIVKPSELL